MPEFSEACRTTSQTPGTGNLALSGTAPSGFVSPLAAFPANDRFPYRVALGAEWEAGIGYHNGTSLVRETPHEGSAGDTTLVNFSAGTKDVFCGLNARLVGAQMRGRQYAASRQGGSI